MKSTCDTYAELTALTRQYILQEHEPTDWVESASETYHYFKRLALEKKEVTTPPQPVAKPAIVLPSKPLIIAEQSPPPQKPSPPPQPPVENIPPPPPVTEVKSLPKKKPPFELEPFGTPPIHDLHDLQKIISEKFPQQQIIETPPSDLIARQINGAWQKQSSAIAVFILSFNEPPQQKAFLANLAKAINLLLAPAIVVNAHKLENEKGWETALKSPDLKLIIATDYGVYALPELMKHYKDQPREAKHYLGSTPLCLLSDISIYLKEPKLKPSLWKAILHTLKP